jgi:hypothetical protein
MESPPRHYVYLALALALGMTACLDQKGEPTAPSVQARTSVRPKISRERISLPGRSLTSDIGLDAVRHAINPDDFVCPQSTPLFDWLFGEVDEVIDREPDIFATIVNTSADFIPFFDAVVLQTTATPQYFGYTGEFTHVLTKTERDVKRFWDISSSDIQLIGIHGTMLLDSDRLAFIYETFFLNEDFSPITHAQAVGYASQVRQALLQSLTLNRGNHPLFSFNALTVGTDDVSIPNKIIIGDGLLEGFKALNLGDVAARALYAHEFAHHVQIQKGYLNDPLHTSGDPPEQTRYRELMADAFSAYYLTHKRGAALNRKRVEQFLEVFFDIGDCTFAHPNHHGTPNQRMRAARFGFDVADQARKQGHILSADQFHALFVARYSSLIAPDAT